MSERQAMKLTGQQRRVLADSDYGEWREHLNLRTTEQQDKDCLFLEGRGQRFLVDYGTENEHEKVLALRRQKRR